MNPHNLVTMSEDQDWECSDCGLIAPSLDELKLLDCKAALNPHNSVSRINIEVSTPAGSSWQCDYCSVVAPTMEAIDLIDCTYEYPPCETCKQTPLCAPKCGSYEAKSISVAEDAWPPELVAMSHEELIKECIGLSNRIADNLDLQEAEARMDRLASLVCAAYDYIGRDTDENFEKEWKRTAIDIVAEKLNCGIVKDCPEPPVCTLGDWLDLIDTAVNGRICVEELFSMGFQCWAKSGAGADDEQWLPEGGSLWLMPVNWFQELPEDIDFVHFDGLSVSKENGLATRDHRMGYMTFGIVHIEAPSELMRRFDFTFKGEDDTISRKQESFTRRDDAAIWAINYAVHHMKRSWTFKESGSSCTCTGNTRCRKCGHGQTAVLQTEGFLGDDIPGHQ